MDGLCGLMPEEEITNPPWGEIGRVITLGAVSLFSKGLLTVANTVEVHNKETWDRHVMQREPGLGLLTVCNHTR